MVANSSLQRLSGSPDILRTPRREIRYLSSEGIHPREIKCLTDLDAALPADWVFYAGLQYFPGHVTPIEMDLIILTDDRVLLVEIKEWLPRLRNSGDQWIVGRGNRRPSPIKSVAAKARKLKTLLRSKLPGVHLYVDSCLVLAGNPVVEGLPAAEARAVLSLADACRLGDRAFARTRLASFQVTMGAAKVWTHAALCDAVFGDRQSFKAQEALFDGYRITEEDLFVHPRFLWADHRAEDRERSNTTALLRRWNFAKLPPMLNAPTERRFVAERERRVYEHLNTVGSWLADGSSLLRPVHNPEGDITTEHFDLLSLPATWRQLPRYLERVRGELPADDALDIIAELVRVVAELHDRQITHRDIGRRNIWLAGPSRIALTGFAISQLPDDKSVADWRATLQGYGPPMPEDAATEGSSGGFRRDVYQLGMLSRDILDAVDHTTASGAPTDLRWLDGWLDTATAQDPANRYSNARMLSDAFTEVPNRNANGSFDHSRLDRFETDIIPYAKWPQKSAIGSGSADIYISGHDLHGDLVVKIWPGIRRGTSVELDLALLRMMEGVARLQTSPLIGYPVFEDVGLSRVGPYIVYRRIEEVGLTSISR
jgi:hypothetical protein